MPELRTSGTASSSWPTPDVPNGGRHLSEEDIRAKGTTERGKRQVGLENVAKLWPTPSASLPQDGEEPETFFARAEQIKAKGINGNGMGTPLAIAAKTWATPRASDGEKGGPNQSFRNGAGLPLASQSVRWRTPSSRDWKGPSAESWRNREKGDPTPTLADQVDDVSSRGLLVQTITKNGAPTSSERRVLNPLFVEALMGWPVGWSACGFSATESSPNRQPSRSDCSTNACAGTGS